METPQTPHTPQTIQVIMRMCDTESLSGSASRPSNFSKESLFNNLMATRDSHTNITIVYDGDELPTFLKDTGRFPRFQILPCKGGNGDISFQNLIMYIKCQQYEPNTIIYILEDDYLHKAGWPRIMREGFGTLQPSFLKLDYITLYDHKDKYCYPMYNELLSKIAISPSVHWRTTPSTTNTFATTYKIFIEDFDIHYSYLNKDHEKFLELAKVGRILGSCMPGYSTHCHKDYMSPCVEWLIEQ